MAEGDVVRTIKITATGENIDSTTASVNNLGDATSKLSDSNDKSTKSSGGAKNALVDLAASIYVAKSAYEALTAASDGSSTSLGKATAALISAFGAILAYAPDKIGAIWQDGIDKLNSYVTLSQKAGDLGVDYYQRLTKAATDAKKPADDYLKIITNINAALDRQLGTDGNQNGSKFNTQVLELQKNGNLQGQTADVNRLNSSVGGQEQLSAALKLIQDAEEAGEKLVALKLAGTLLGPDAAANLKADNDYIFQMQKSIQDVQASDLIKQADVDRAVAMQKVLDDSQKIIGSWFVKAASDWSGLGIGIQQLWVNANENFASVLTWLSSILAKTKEIANVKPDDPENSIWTKMGNFFTNGGTDMPNGVTKLDSANRQFEIAKQSLGSKLGNRQNITNGQRQSQSTDDKLTVDQSSPAAVVQAAAKAQKDYNDAVDRAINSLNKHAATQKADADAVGLGDAALAAYRASAAETAAVQANGGKETEAQAKSFSDAAIAATNAADALAKAKVASDISRGSQLAFVSPEDVQIANQLKGIYGNDIPAALNSSQAAAMRMNNAMSTINTTGRAATATFATDFVGALVQGETKMQALEAASAALGKTLLNAGLNSLVNTGLNAVAPTATQTASATASATILTSAGTTLAASMVAGATSAAGILAGGGTAAGVGVDVGTSVGGATLVTSGATAGGFIATAAAALGVTTATLTAIMGPLAALLAVAAGIGFSMFGSSDDSKKDAANQAAIAQTTQLNADSLTRQQQDQYNMQQAQLSTGDTGSLNNQLQTFDLQAQQQRAAEAQKGDGAIVELEQSLAAQRLAIIQKSNAAITQTMEDFLNSVKTGSQSILSPADQLAYERNLFNSQLAGAQGGDSTDLNALTSTASALLTLAQNFYASGTGYADTYTQVTNAIQSLANNPGQTGYADPNKTGITADNSWTTVNMPGGYQATATISGMAEGGIVGNGLYNKDSVVARYAGGGSIALAGGEAVTRATSVNANTIGMLNHINRTGNTPKNDNSDVVRTLAQGFNGQTTAIVNELRALSSRVGSLEDTTRMASNKRRVPGMKAA
jgi:hypothetical protein